uniref:TIGR02269 family lipoprotein n=1 Tax=Archangium lipolyticum TaxID=2970465 RepID=UPI002149C39B|nr:TIGR02269 family lipoprotein [Archangium lipolyticum]
MWRRQEMLQPAMTALSSREHELVEAAAQDVPPLVGHLTDEFTATVGRMHVAAESLQKVLLLKEAIETVTMLSTMRFSLPSVPPSAPALVGIGLAVGGDGVMMGTRIVASAEWVELVHQLVRAGVLSLPVVSAAVRVQAGQVMLAQAHNELPKGVREALGDGPEVRAMHETGKTGAGMAEPPQHHVMPKEFREWFERRGFTGEMDIDEFCVKLEQAKHEAIHGGGNWKLGRTWPGEWNRMLMKTLRDAEVEAGRMLTRNEVMDIVADRMKFYDIPMNFTPWRR